MTLLYKIYPRLQELKKKFDRLGDDYDSALGKYMAKKPKDPGIHEVSFLEYSDTLSRMKYMES